ncbi:hypothetical protein ACWCXH_20630 [Kitasatospora sp. NPDC001660]
MTVRLRTRPPAPALRCRAAGHALLVHPKGQPDPQALEFTARLAPDPQHTPVVLDLPHGALDSQWEPVARLLADRPGSLRLLPGRATPAEARCAGQRIADRLNRVVLVPDGRPVLTAGGGLFVPIDHGAGWLQLRPGGLAQPESRRYPRPMWEFSTPDRPWATSPYGVVESVPCGVWLRSARPSGLLDGWRRLVETLPADPHVLTVVLGSPGGPAVPLADAIGLWDTVLPSVRRRVRFVPYGPVAVPAGAGALGQELADAFGQHVVVCSGLPVVPAGHDAPPYVRGLLADGTPGWHPFAAHYRYAPRPHEHTGATPPELLGVRTPLPGLPHVGTGVWELAAGTVLEIVQSGLWIRPTREPADGDDVRRVPAPQGYAALLYDRSEPTTADRMRAHAQDLLWRLPPEARDAYRIAPADAPGSAAPNDLSGLWPLGEPVAMDDGTRPGTAARTAPQRPAHLAFWATASSGATGTAAGGAPAAGVDPAASRARRRALARPAGGTADDLGVTAATAARITALPAAEAASPGVVRPPSLDRTQSALGAGPSRPSESLLTSVGPGLDAPDAAPRLSSAPPAADAGSPSTTAPAVGWTDSGRPGTDEPTDPFNTRTAGPARPGSGPHRAEPGAPASPIRTELPAPPAVGAAPPATPGPVVVGGPRQGGTAPDPALDAPSPGRIGPTGSAEPGSAPVTPTTPVAPAAPAAPPVGETPASRRPTAPPTVTSDPTRPDRTPPAPSTDDPAAADSDGPETGGSDTGQPDTGTADTANTDTADGDEPGKPDADEAAPAPAPRARPAGIPGIRLESVPPPELAVATPRNAAPDSPSPVTSVLAAAAPSGVVVQPVPRPGASAVPQERGMAQEREWVRRTFARQFNAAAGTVSRVLSESPGLRGASRAEEADAYTDLAALRLYLTGDSTALDAAVRTATVGPHVPLARCVAAGLRRLPSYRGATLLRAALHPSERAWYREGDVLTEWAFCTAWARTAEPAAAATDFLIWSLTARRTTLVAPNVADRVVFLPGTRFRVLGTDDRDRLLLRELSASEGSEDGKARVALDEIALEGLAHAADGPDDTDAAPARAGDAGWTPPSAGAPPGLLPRTARKAAAA